MKLSKEYIEELLNFSQKYSRTLVERFLTELISTHELIFDLKDDKGRMGLAVLLDKVHNPANDSCLEILGMREDADSNALVSKFIILAQNHPTMKHSGFQIGFHQNSITDEKILSALGLEHYYDTYEMLQTDQTKIKSELFPEIEQALSDDCDEIYHVLCESFAQSPDTSIPDLEAWRESFLKSSKSHFFIWRSDDKIVGFTNLIEADNGSETEIRTLGVLLNARGKGIGKHLLNYSLKQSFNRGYNTCRLTVAVENEKALSMYTHAGFLVAEKFKTYRMNF